MAERLDAQAVMRAAVYSMPAAFRASDHALVNVIMSALKEAGFAIVEVDQVAQAEVTAWEGMAPDSGFEGYLSNRDSRARLDTILHTIAAPAGVPLGGNVVALHGPR